MNILRLNKISPLADKVFPKTYKLVDACETPDAIILRSFKMHEYALPESVLCIGRAGAGVNNIPTDKYAEKGVVVFNTPGANANAVKELVICSLFLSGRKIVDGINWANSLKGTGDVAAKVEKGKEAYVGGEILGKTLGVVGLGAIGLLVANAAVALGMKVIGYDPFLNKEKAAKLDSRITTVDTLDKMYPDCDFITLHVPLADNTRGMINTAVIGKCRNGVSVINCARAELVNNADIIAALNSGKVNRYVTDFPVDDVVGVDKIVSIPHLGASTPEAEDNCALMAAEQMVDFIENGNVVNSVNFPAVKADRKCKARITVAFRGELDLNAECVKAGIKVCALNSGKRGDFGYAIIDTDSADKANELKKLANVLKIRVI